jgi:dTMP kinase
MDGRIECATSLVRRHGAGRSTGLRTGRRDGSIAYTRAVGASDSGPARGVFITLEGPDGSGKSSLLRGLAAWLEASGCDVVATREPGSTPLGEQVRRLVLDTEPKIDRTGRADALLFAASRAQHVAEVIRPALERGAIVVCDRYADSSMAYQGAGSGVPMDELAVVQHFATGGLVPDLTILLDLPVEAGLARKSAEVTRFEAYHDREYHQRVRDAFLGFAAAEPGRYAIVDATRDEAGVLEAAVGSLGRLAAREPCLGAALAPRG